MTDLIHTRHTETGRIQAVTPDQFEVFSDVLEEITPEEAEQARLDAILNPPVEPEVVIEEPEAPEGDKAPESPEPEVVIEEPEAPEGDKAPAPAAKPKAKAPAPAAKPKAKTVVKVDEKGA